MKKLSVLILIVVLCFSIFQFVHFASTTSADKPSSKSIPTSVSENTSSTALYLNPSTIEANPLEVFTVALNVDSVIDLFDWQAGLGWDPQILEFVSATKGDFFDSSASWGFALNDTEGWALIFEQRQGDIGVSGSGTLANIVFRGKETGECALSLINNTRLYDSNPELVLTPPNLGDANNDSIVNMHDAQYIILRWGGFPGNPKWDPNADFNADGFLDSIDLQCVIWNFNRHYPPYPEPYIGYRQVEIPYVIGIHDITVEDVTLPKTVVGAGYSVFIDTTVANQVCYPETFNVTLYANETVIALQNVTLTIGASIALSFTWNTTGFAKGNYAISTYAEAVPGETNLADNNFTGGWIFVAMVGDITGPSGIPDGKVDMYDVSNVARRFMAQPPSPDYNPNFDINSDGIIDMRDIATVARHFGENSV